MTEASHVAEISRPSRFDWWRQSTPEARRALAAACFGWMLDSFDVMLYALVLASLIVDLGITKQMAGILGSITLLSAAVGGLAMAPDQVSFFGLMSATPPTMNTGGHIFYNGIGVGLEAYW